MAILSTITDQRLQLSSLIIGKKFNQRSTVGLCSLYCRILGKSAISHWKMFTKASMSFNDFYWLSNRFIKTVEARRKWKQYSRITRSGSLAFTAGQTLSLLEVDQRLRLEGSAEKYGLYSIEWNTNRARPDLFLNNFLAGLKGPDFDHFKSIFWI